MACADLAAHSDRALWAATATMRGKERGIERHPLNRFEMAISTALRAERAFLARLDGSCRTPIAGLAELSGDVVTFRGQLLAPDGTAAFEARQMGPAATSIELGISVADALIAVAGADFLARHFGSNLT